MTVIVSTSGPSDKMAPQELPHELRDEIQSTFPNLKGGVLAIGPLEGSDQTTVVIDSDVSEDLDQRPNDTERIAGQMQAILQKYLGGTQSVHVVDLSRACWGRLC